MPSPYEEARRVGRGALRQAVLEAAGELLANEGPGALTMRRIADEVGASTTVVYRVFESKNEILNAMVTDGHNGLRERLEAIPATLGPFEHLAATARAYRDAARADPARYQLMFGTAIPGYQPNAEARAASRASFDALAAVVRECIDAGVIQRRADPRFVAEILIAAAHGAVSLEITGHFEDSGRSDERFAALTAAAVRPFLVDPRA